MKKLLLTTYLCTQALLASYVCASEDRFDAVAAAGGHCTAGSGKVIERYDTDAILRYVEEGERRLAVAVGKPLVIVAGTKGAGKGVTINHLINVPLYEMETGDLDRVDTSMDSPGPAIGHAGYCTAVPSVYTSEFSPYVILDTRGFDPQEKVPSEFIAASIITEIAVKQARDVRLMLVTNYNSLVTDRGSPFMGLGRTLGKIVVGTEIPILLGFNRYLPKAPRAVVSFLSKTPEEQMSEALEASVKAVQNVIGMEEESIDKVGMGLAKTAWKGFKNLLGKKTSEEEVAVLRDPTFQEALLDINYTNFLRYNLEKGNVVYISPLDGDISRSRIFDALARLDPVPTGSLVFKGYNPDRIKFNDVFAEHLKPFSLLLGAKIILERYSQGLINELLEEAKRCAAYHTSVYDKFAGGVSEEEVKSMEAAYEVDMAELERRKVQIGTRKSQAVDSKSKLLEEINRLLDGPRVRRWTDEFNIPANWFSWVTHRSYYPDPIRFVKWEHELDEHTKLFNIEQNDGYYLTLNYGADFWKPCKGEVRVYIDPKDDPDTKKSIEGKYAEIEALKRSLEAEDNLLRQLLAENQSTLKARVENKKRFFENYVQNLTHALEIKGRLEGIYKRFEDNIHFDARLARRINADTSMTKDFIGAYERLLGLRGVEVSLSDALTDQMFSVPLMDPVQLICRGGGHNRTYERSAIARTVACPDCRDTVKGFKPLPVNILEIVDNLISDSVKARDLLSKTETLLH